MSLEGLVGRAKKAFLAGALAASLSLPVTLPAWAQTGVDPRPRQATTIEQRVPDYMFHKISAEKPGRYALTPRAFEDALERLYRAGFITVPREAYYDGCLDGYVPPGKRPVLLSDDDGDASVIEWERDAADCGVLRDAHGDPIPSKDSFYGILKRFADEHPGFGSYCTYFINFRKGVTFDDPAGQAEKLRTLIEDPSSDIGYHTVNHTLLGKKDAAWMRQDIAAWDATFTRITGYDAASVVRFAAYPGGQRPRDPGAEKVLERRFSGASDAWGGAAYARDSARFSRYDEPRIEVHTRAEYEQPDTIAWAVNLARQEGAWPETAVARADGRERIWADLRPLRALLVGNLSAETSTGSFFSDALGLSAPLLDIARGYGLSSLGERTVLTRAPQPLLYHVPSSKEEACETVVELLDQGADAALAGSVTRFYCGEAGVKQAVKDHIAAAATRPYLSLTRFSDDDLPDGLKERVLHEYLYSPDSLVRIAARLGGESGLRLGVADLSHLAVQEILCHTDANIGLDGRSLAKADPSVRAHHER